MSTKTENAFLVEARKFAQEAQAALNDFTKVVRQNRSAEFIAAGGCLQCNGRGWIVIWDTMDSMTGCYHESATCPTCKGEKRQGGAEWNYGVSSKYDAFHQGTQPLLFAPNEQKEYERLLAATDSADNLAKSLSDALNPCIRGREVVVVRGRKTPIGTKGTVFWIGPNKYGPGTRLGIRGATEDIWIDAANCEGILESVGQV